MKPTHAVNLSLGAICTLALALSLAPTAWASTPQPVQLFAFACSDKFQSCPQGNRPQALIQASDGNFYGVATGGGTQNSGTIFSITPSGAFTLLFTFQPGDGYPTFTLVEAKDGTLWGHSVGGGQFGNGTIFKIKKDGTDFQIVYSFPADSSEFFFNVSLIAGKNGKIYGSSPGGGGLGCNGYGCGTIFQITPKTGAFKTLHVLNGTSDGGNPSGLIQASNGSFYGVAMNNVFRITPAGKFTVIAALPSGDYPYTNGSGAGGGGVIQGSNGHLFGVLEDPVAGAPRLYELLLTGKSFQVHPALPGLQYSTLLSNLCMTKDGNLWLASYGASGAKGAIVEISPQDGSVLQTIPFSGTNGQNPAAPVIQGTDGNLYGTTFYGGTDSGGEPDGVVFSLAPGVN